MTQEETPVRTVPKTRCRGSRPASSAAAPGAGEEHPSKLALLAFYRGVHCPICRHWLAELERLVPRFTEHGVSVIALSCDTRERAERAKREWRLEQLRIGYGVNPDDARKAGLYLTEQDDHHCIPSRASWQ